jgi:hypothetical protein
MPKIRARTSWADRKTGDEFDVNEIEATILCAPDLPGGQKAEYVDRAMTPVEPQQTQADSPPAPGAPEKRRYQRRDLQAEK